jgi:flagellar protein FliL
MKKILLLLLPVIAFGGGAFGGNMLKPAPETPAIEAEVEEEAPVTTEAIRLPNQFVVPVVRNGRVSAMVVMSLSIEVTPGMGEAVFLAEPKLRDALLAVLFDHANAGSFDGSFTEAANLDLLRSTLTEAAQAVLGKDAAGVLILELARQDG